MTIQTEVPVQSQVYNFMAREHDVFAGLDVDHHSIAATFTDTLPPNLESLAFKSGLSVF